MSKIHGGVQIKMTRYALDPNGICKGCPYYAYLQVDAMDHDLCVYDDRGKCFQKGLSRYFLVKGENVIDRSIGGKG